MLPAVRAVPEVRAMRGVNTDRPTRAAAPGLSLGVEGGGSSGYDNARVRQTKTACILSRAWSACRSSAGRPSAARQRCRATEQLHMHRRDRNGETAPRRTARQQR